MRNWGSSLTVSSVFALAAVGLYIGFNAANWKPVLLYSFLLGLGVMAMVCSLEALLFAGTCSVLLYLLTYIPVRFTLGNPWFFPYLHSLVFACLFWLASPRIFSDRIMRWNTLDMLIALLLLWSAALGLLSIPKVGLMGAIYGVRLHVLDGLMYFVVRVLSPGRFNSIANLFIAVTAIQACYNFYLFILMKILGVRAPEWLFLFQEATESNLRQVLSSGGTYLRLGGFFGSESTSGVLAAAGALFTFCMAYVGPTVEKRGWYKFLCFIMVLSVLLITSRMSLLAFFVVFAIVVVWSYRKRQQGWSRQSLIWTASFSVGAIILVLWKHEFIHLKHTYVDEFVPAIEIQMEAIRQGIEDYTPIVRSNPLAFLGGAGYPPFPFDTNWKLYDVISSTDAFFIEFFGTMGVIGSFLFVSVNWLAAGYTAALIRAKRHVGQVLGSLAVMLVLVLSMFHRPGFIGVGVHVWYFIFAALLSSYYSILQSENNIRKEGVSPPPIRTEGHRNN